MYRELGANSGKWLHVILARGGLMDLSKSLIHPLICYKQSLQS